MNPKRSRLAQQIVNLVLLVTVVGLAGWLSNRYKTDFDWTYGHRNTLTPASQKLLQTLPDPIHFYAFVSGDQADQRLTVEQGVRRYQEFKKNVTLTFIDPALDPEKTKTFKIDQSGQMVVEYDGRRETLDPGQISEPAVSAALQRLASKGNVFVAFLTGHGERAIDDFKQNGYSDFAQALRDKGLHVTSLNLAAQPAIPENLAALIVADPSSELLPAEQRVIEHYVNIGGNLLWLADTEHPPGLENLAKALGISWQNGYAVFPNYQMLGTGNPGIYLATDYPPNPITQDLNKITVFPFVRSLTYDRSSGWHYDELLKTTDSAWLETTQKNGAITFDPKHGDIGGPLTIGLSMTRYVTPPPAAAGDSAKPAAAASTRGAAAKATDKAGTDKPKQQRVAVIGDADFLANGNFKVLGNSQLGIAAVNWLAERNAALSVNVPNAPDRQLYLPGWATWLITAGYIVLLPLLLLVFGVTRWAIRRRR
ncbi:MAG: GldG family protein [Gammaproteobacteria bacterium]|nr:GldG family protein [Gammaproteobacteria bacterium]